jgi:cyclopropane fatty-acyl-phospholipid synthase-like methyltransferase
MLDSYEYAATTTMTKPFSQACENNKRPILAHLRNVFAAGETVLEIGSRTAQHVEFFAAMMPKVRWQPSDIAENMPTLIDALSENTQSNVAPPVMLDVTMNPWPLGAMISNTFDGIFSANTLHIMPASAVECFFAGVGKALAAKGRVCVYGPFKYNGEFTTQSNADFDASLRTKYPLSGLRDFEWVDALAQAQGLSLVRDFAMPANNQMLVWQR